MTHSELSRDCPNAFTVDVEDYFQVSAFEHRVSRKQWDTYPSRVVASTQCLLDILEKHSVTATFYILGWVADRHPALVRRIQQAGHELASHGYWHRLIYNQTPEEFRDDLRASVEAIANASGVVVKSYRAPSFSIIEKSLWAIDVLIELGFEIDSSVFPIRGHDRYGLPDAPKEIHTMERAGGKIIEFPPSAWHMGRVNLPIGGGYFRILPWLATKTAIRRVRKTGRPVMFYIHPWEVDPNQPRLEGLSRKTQLRHYMGLNKTANRLHRLLSAFPFGSVSQIVTQHSAPKK